MCDAPGLKVRPTQASHGWLFSARELAAGTTIRQAEYETGAEPEHESLPELPTEGVPSAVPEPRRVYLSFR